MSFVSLNFAIFFPFVVVVYYLCKPSLRNLLLLFASYFFYMCFKVEYGALILLSTLIDYWAGQMMGGLAQRERKPYLWLSVGANLGLLGIFKYGDFFLETSNSILGHLGIEASLPLPNLLLPIGISFYTFQSLSYTIDVYRGVRPAERRFLNFALYVSFFPQLAAGPIERSTQLLPQFDRHVIFNYPKVRDGCRLILWGFAKKLIVADHLGLYVDEVYANPEQFTSTNVHLGLYFFALQVYADFSAYTDIARGCAKILGFDLMENFRQPYFSTSIRDFWRRWHISLYSWFRDYLYAALGGNRRRAALNILLVFTLSGLWHGAAWTFVLFGIFHGMAYVVEHTLKHRLSITLPSFIAMAVTYHVFHYSLILFRSPDLAIAASIVGKLWGSFEYVSHYVPHFNMRVACLSAAIFLVIDWFKLRSKNEFLLDNFPQTVRWVVYLGLIVSLMFFAKIDHQLFIYFQF